MKAGHNTSKLRQLATATLLALVAGLFSAVLIASPSHAAASSVAGQWPQTSPDQYNTPTPVDSSCVAGPDTGSYQDVNGQMTWVAGSDSTVCWWNVARDPSNPDMNWNECQYWAVELRPDIYTNVIEPTNDWRPYDWVQLAKDAGYTVSNTPAVGDLAIWPSGYDGAGTTDGGHVAVVTATHADGQSDDSIITSDMNIDGDSGGNGADHYSSASEVDGDGAVLAGVAQHIYFIEMPGGSTHVVPPTSGGTGTSTKPSSGDSTGGSSGGSTGGSTHSALKETAFSISKRVIKSRTLRVTMTVTRGIAAAVVRVTKGRVKHRLHETKNGRNLVFIETLPRGMWHIAFSLTASTGYRTPTAPPSVVVLKK